MIPQRDPKLISSGFFDRKREIVYKPLLQGTLIGRFFKRHRIRLSGSIYDSSIIAKTYRNQVENNLLCSVSFIGKFQILCPDVNKRTNDTLRFTGAVEKRVQPQGDLVDGKRRSKGLHKPLIGGAGRNHFLIAHSEKSAAIADICPGPSDLDLNFIETARPRIEAGVVRLVGDKVV